MEVLKYLSQTWADIPHQDNPAFHYIDGDKEKGRMGECLMVCKVLPFEAKCVGQGYIVLHVPKQGDVKRIGIFWNYQMASLFASALASHQQ